MKYNLQQIILGLPIGVIWALLASGVVMIYRASRVLNLAVGGMSMMSAYALFAMSQQWHWPLGLSVVLALIFSAAMGFAMERLLIRPLRDRPRLVSVIMTVGVLALLTEFAAQHWGVDRQSAPSLLPQSPVRFLGIALGLDQILIFFITLAIVGSLVYLFRRTTLGVSMRAISDDRSAALLMGVPVDRVSSLTWIIGSLLSGVAGILLSPLIGLTPQGLVFQSIPALAAALFGGLVSIELAFVGAMVLGVVWSLLGGLQFGGFRLQNSVVGAQEVAIFSLVIAFLLVRWKALFGSELREEEI